MLKVLPGVAKSELGIHTVPSGSLQSAFRGRLVTGLIEASWTARENTADETDTSKGSHTSKELATSAEFLPWESLKRSKAQEETPVKSPNMRRANNEV